MNPPFVKKFDFRGVYNEDLFDKDAYYLGLAIKEILPLKKVLIGWDTRVSSMSLAMNFISALEGSEIEISYLDTCPIDYVTAASHAFDFDFSVMFTGSHNPWNWTGLLMHTKGGASVEGELVTKIVDQYNKVSSREYKEPRVNIMDHYNFQTEIENIYKEKISSLIPLKEIKEMKVVVDIGDGSGSKALDIIESLVPQVTFARLNDRMVYDSDTPHTADPSVMENMQQLMKQVTLEHYDAGFAFDSDADRVLAVDEHGEYINGSMIGAAMIDVFTRLGNAMHTYGYAVECGPAIYNAVIHAKKQGHNQLSIMPVPVGRSILRRLVREEKVSIAVENVGHFYIKDFFMTDSGAFSMVLILYWMSKHGTLSSLSAMNPDGKRTQFHLPLVENQVAKVQKLSNEVNAHFVDKQQRRIEVDGVRYEFFEDEYLITWYAMRPSGYEKAEKYYFGSLNEDDYKVLLDKIREDN